MSHPPPLPAELYKGSVNAWECDDGGHLNVRFHFERAIIGLAHLAHALEMPRAFTATAGATLTPLEAHLRFSKEARQGAPLVMHGGVIEMGETDALVCLDMRHADGAPSSAFTLRVAHTDTRVFKPFPWSARSRAAAERFKCPLPPHAAPRSLERSRTPLNVSAARAKEVGAARIGATMIFPDQCDVFGRMRAEHLMGRVSDSVPNSLTGWRAELAAEAGAGGAAVAPAGAVVEARLAFYNWPRGGDLLEIYSGVVEVHEKTMRLCHWAVDPESGHAWASMEVTALTFDSITRKALAPSAALRARMQERAIPAMAP